MLLPLASRHRSLSSSHQSMVVSPRVRCVARGSWRCRRDHLVSSRLAVLSGPRRHSAWIGWSLHLRVPGRAVPRRHQIGSSMPRFGRACFASPSIRGILGGGLGVGSLRVEEHRSRGVRKKLKQMGREEKEKAKPPPANNACHPKVQRINTPLFFIHFLPGHRHTNPVRPKPNRQSHKIGNHGSIIRPSRSQSTHRGTPPLTPVRFPGKSRPPAASQALIPRASGVSS